MALAVYPVLPGWAFDVIKTPGWATRIQRSPSGREVREQDWLVPVYRWTLAYGILHDKSFGAYQSPNTALRTLMDFFNSRAGGWDSFLFDDPTDDSVTGEGWPEAQSVADSFSIDSDGTNYAVSDEVFLSGGSLATVPGVPLAFSVSSIGAGGAVTGLVLDQPNAAYTIVPGTTALATTTNAAGTGLTLDVGWNTTVQPERALVSPGFTDPVWPNIISNVYYNGVAQSGWTINGLGTVDLPDAFTSDQPDITADFTYYFRVVFEDTLNFEQFQQRLWVLNQVKLTSIPLV